MRFPFVPTATIGGRQDSSRGRRRHFVVGWCSGVALAALVSFVVTTQPVSAAPPSSTDSPRSNVEPDAKIAPTAATESSGTTNPKYTTTTLRGRVGWMSELLAQRYGIRSDNDVAESVVALEGNDGRIYPIVKDFRGRGFHMDPRMRDVEMELVVRQFDGSPMVQVVRVLTIKDGKRFEFDYWCDICSIPLYELKECSCCQGPIRIREREVTDDEPLD